VPPLAREDALSVAQIDTQLQRPWDALLHALEQCHVENVALISVEVQGTSGNLRLVGEAKDMDHALAYVRLLRQSPALRSVYLSGQEEKDLISGKVVRFSLDASWSAAL
jgi:Tfp pilus assembly protein PilN